MVNNVVSKNITIKDISKSLGFSISTISKALNDSHEISVKTKEKVKNFAKEYNYSPNFYAKKLKTKNNINRKNTLFVDSQSSKQLISEVANNPELKSSRYSICQLNSDENVLDQISELSESKISSIILVYNN